MNSLFLFFALLIGLSANAQLTAHAGTDKTICPGSNITIGGTPTATGGFPPYTYVWSPSTGLSSTTSANPIATPPNDIYYMVTVTDDSGNVATDFMFVGISYLQFVNAGADTNLCANSSLVLGTALNVTGMGVTYSWNPTTFLDNASLPRPTATPTTSMSYTLTATVPGCTPKTDVININYIPTPPISAGNDTTIHAGERAILNASGGYLYSWSPISTLTYYYTAHPNAEPMVTTTYVLYGFDHTGLCPSYDSVTVFVEPSTDVVIYNTFTPNGDENNDFWYIGNIYKYPNNKLEVYNRYGKLVYKTSNYQNTWDGKAFGEDLPEATYFYVLDLGDDQGVYHGTVTIIK